MTTPSDLPHSAELPPETVAVNNVATGNHSDEAMIRAYALGLAHAAGHLTPTDDNWAAARSWWSA